MFCSSSSWCFGLVCSVWLWYLLTMLTYFCMGNVGQFFFHIGTALRFRRACTWMCIYTFSPETSVDVPVHVCASTHSHQKLLGAQWLNDRVHVSRLNNYGFEPHRRHCVVSLRKHTNPCLKDGQQRKNHPDITEKLLNQIKQSNRNSYQRTSVQTFY